MVRLSFIHAPNDHAVSDHIFSIPVGICVFIMVSVVVALCANHGRRRASRTEESKTNNVFNSIAKDDYYQEKLPPRSPLRSPKQLITTISNKAMNTLLISHKRGGSDGSGGHRVGDEEFGQGGLWQKEILMGVKCQPLEFSGVIYYDCDGRQISELPPRSPKSPRISKSPEFTFPVIKSTL